jgi:hypothetical protein
MARLCSCECSASAAWLTAVPVATMLVLKDGECRVAMQHLGLTLLPANTVGLRCSWRAVTTAADCDHAMTCASVAGKATLRHNILKGILRSAIHRAGIASSLEPTMHRLPSLEAEARCSAPGSATAGREARGAILMALESGPAIVDVSATHPPGVAKRAAAARTDRATADRRGQGEEGCVQPARTQQLPLHTILPRVLWPPGKARHGLAQQAGGASRGCRARVQEGEGCAVDTAGAERRTVPRNLPFVPGLTRFAGRGHG